MIITCGHCSNTWSGVNRAHCGGEKGCHLTFGGQYVFDAHRKHGECQDPVATRYGGNNLRRNDRGVWVRDKPFTRPIIKPAESHAEAIEPITLPDLPPEPIKAAKPKSRTRKDRAHMPRGYEPDVTAFEPLVEEFLKAVKSDVRYGESMCQTAKTIENKRTGWHEKRSQEITNV